MYTYFSRFYWNSILNTTNQRTFGAILSIIKTIISSLTNMIYVPILIYCMGTSQFGIYQLIGSLIGYINNADFGHCATTRFYTIAKVRQDTKEQSKILGFSLVFYIVISCILSLFGYILYTNLDTIFDKNLSYEEIVSVKELFILFLINIAITFSSSPFTSIINSHEKFVFLKILQIGQSILRPITVIVFLFCYPYGLTVAIIQTLYNITYTCIRIWYCFAKLGCTVSFVNLSILPIKSFIILASSTLFVFFLEQFLWRTNQIVLGIYSGINDVAVYGVASVLFLAYASFAAAIPSVFLPKITTMISTACTPRELSDFFIKIGRIQFVLLLLILLGFTFVGQEFVALWAGPDFGDAYALALIIMVPLSIELLQNIGLVIMQAQNKYAYRVKVYIMMGLLNLVLAIPFAIMWGPFGCAWATAITMLVGDGILMNYYFYKYLKLDMVCFWKEMAKIIFAAMPVVPVALFLNTIWPEYDFVTFLTKITFILLVFLFCQSLYAVFTWAKKDVNFFCIKNA